MAAKDITDSIHSKKDGNKDNFVEVDIPEMPEESKNVLTAFLLERETETESVTEIADDAPVHPILNRIDAEMNNEDEHNLEKPKRTHGVFCTGNFGAGKSTTINSLVGKLTCQTGDTFEAVTKQPKQITLRSKNGNTLQIYDTPGFQPDEFENIRCLDRVVLSEFPCNVVLFIQNIGESRITPTLLEEIKVYKYDYDLPIILVLNKAFAKTRDRSKAAWMRNLVDIKYDKLIDAIVVLNTVDIENQEVPDDIHHLVKTISLFITRQSAPNRDLSTRSGKVAEQLRLIQALKCSKHAVICVGMAATAALAVGLSPVPFSDSVLLIPIEVGMFAGICAAFNLRLSKGLLIWLLSSGVGAFGIGFGIVKLLDGFIKMIPGASVAAMAIDSTMAFTSTLALGFSLIAVLRTLCIRGIDISGMSNEERKQLLKEHFTQEVSQRWRLLFRNNNQRAALQKEIQCFDGVDVDTNLTNNESFDIDKLLLAKEQVLKQEKLQNSEKLCKLQELKREKKTLEDVCCICLRCRPNIITQPCGHCCMCASDYADHKRKILVCPIPDCLQPISSFTFLKT